MRRRLRTTLWVLCGILACLTTTSAAAASQAPDTQRHADPSTLPVPDLEVRTTGPFVSSRGDTLSLIVQVINFGSVSVTDVLIRQALPPSTRFVSATDDGQHSGGFVGWPRIASLTAGSVVSYEVRLLPHAGREIQMGATRAEAPRSDPGLLATRTATSGLESTPAANGASSRLDVLTSSESVASADVAIRVTGPAAVTNGDTIEYILEVRNDGPNPAEHVFTTDVLPPQATFLSASGGGTEQSGIVSWPEIRVLRPAQVVTFRIRVLAPACGLSLVNSGSVRAQLPADPDLTNNSAAATTVVTGGCALPDIAIAKAAPFVANVNDTVSYSILVTNRSSTAATNVHVTDTLPPNLAFGDASDAWTRSGNILSWPAIPRLAPGDTVYFGVSGTATTTGLLDNTAAVTAAEPDTDPSNNVSRTRTLILPVQVQAEADIAVVKSGPAGAPAGDTISYSIVVRNLGPDSAQDITVRDTLPALATFAVGPAGAVITGREVMWIIAGLGPGASNAYTVQVVAPTGPATLVNIVRATSASPADPDSTNNRSEVSTLIAGFGTTADVAVEKIGPQVAGIGDSLTYVMRVFNNGPASATGVQLSDTLAANVTLVSTSPAASVTGRTLTWPAVPAMAVGDTIQYVIRVVPGGGVLCGGIVENVATVSSAGPSDPDLSNNVSRIETAITSQCGDVDIALVKEASGQFPAVGEGTFRFTVRNVGPVATRGPITVTDELPSGLSFVSGGGSGWVVTGSGRNVAGIFDGVLQAGGEAWFDVMVAIAAGLVGELCNTGIAATAGDDGDDPNNVSTVCVDIGDSVLRLEKLTAAGVVSRGDLIDYRIRITATGTIALSGVEVTDRLPAGFRYVASTTRVAGAVLADPLIAGRDLTWHIGALDSGSPLEITYKVRVGPGAPLGEAVNYARARDGGGRDSNSDSARVEVRAGDLSDEGVIVGRVFLDSIIGSARQGTVCVCAATGDGEQDSPEPGIAGVAVYLQDGTAATTDAGGRFVFYSLAPRTWMVRVDPGSLPAGAGLARITNRHSADGGSMLVDLKRGELHRADFAVAGRDAALRTEIDARRATAAAGASEVRAFGPGSAQGPPSMGLAMRRYETLVQDPLGAAFERALGDSVDSDSVLSAAFGVSVPADTLYGPGFAMGFVEARIDHRSIRSGSLIAGRDRFEDALRSISTASDDGRTEAGARAALYYQGAIAEEYGVTLRLDTERDENTRFFRDIRPDELYPVWGDGSVGQYGAVSRNRFYARVERGASHLTFGDFNSGQRGYGQAGPRVLGEYARTLTGAYHQLDTDRFALSAFASRDRSSQVVDVIAGAGVSGPYLLSRADVLVNSERVELVTRDRDQPAVIRDVVLLERNLDYAIEPLTGRLIFKRPIPSIDDEFNPVEIRATYEVEAGVDRFWVYGLAGQVRPVGFLELGGSAVRDDDPAGRMDLASVNAAVVLGRATMLTGEFARTDSAGSDSGDAARLELRHSGSTLSGRLYWMDSDESFRNPSSAIGRGRQDIGFLARARIDGWTAVFAEGLRTENNQTGASRRGGRVGLDRAVTEWLRAQLAYRRADESGYAGADTINVNAIGLRLLTPFPGSARAQIFGEFEQDVAESDRRRAEIGINVRLPGDLRLYGRHEILRSLASPFDGAAGIGRNGTIIGLSGGETGRGSLFSEYRIAEGMNGREAHAAIGLRNRWTLREGTRINTSFERLSPVGGPGRTTTAAAIAADFTGSPAWKGSTRLELRATGGDENLFGSVGYGRKLTPDLTFLGSSVVSVLLDGGRAFERTRLGFAYREADRSKWNGLARYEHRYERDTETVGFGVTRQAHLISAHADASPKRAILLRGQWVSKFVSEESGNLRTSENAHLLGARGTVDITSWLDAGAIGRTLFSGDAGSIFGLGAELGLVLVNNLRLAIGYNAFGFRDREFSADEQTDRGPYVQIGYKFDEGLFRGGEPTPQGGAGCRCPSGEAPLPPAPDPVDLDVTIRGPSQAISTDVITLVINTFNRGGGWARSTTTRTWITGPGPDRRTVLDTTVISTNGPLEPGHSRTDTIVVDLRDRLGPVIGLDSLDVRFEAKSPAPDPFGGNDTGHIVIHVWPPNCDQSLPASCAPNPMPVVTGPNRVTSDTIRVGVEWRNVRLGTIRLPPRIFLVPLATIVVEPGDTVTNTTGGGDSEIELTGGPPGDTLPPGGSYHDDILLRVTDTVGRVSIRVRISTDREPRLPWDIAIDPAIEPFPRPVTGICAGLYGPPDSRCTVRLAVSIETQGGIEGETVPVTLITRNVGHVPAQRVAVGARIDDRSWWTGTGVELVGESRDWLVRDAIAPNEAHRVTVFVRCQAVDIPFRAHVTAAGGSPGGNRTEAAVPCRPRPAPAAPERVADLTVSIQPVVVDGHAVRFRVTTRNIGPVAAADVRTSLQWPVGVTYTESGMSEAGPGFMEWPLESLGGNDSIFYLIDLVMPRATGEIEVEARAGTSSPQIVNAFDRATSTVLVQQVIIRDTVLRSDTIIMPPDTIRRTIERFDTIQSGTVVILPQPIDSTIIRWLLILVTVLVTSLIVYVISEILRRWRMIPAAVPALVPAPVVPAGPAEDDRAVVPLSAGTVTSKTRIRDIEHVRGIVEIDGVRGTGFLVERDRWMTCAHIVQKRGIGGAITIRFGSDRVIHGTIEKLDTHADLAVIRLASPIDDIEPLEFAPAAPVSPSLVSFGFREHGAETWTEGDGVLSEVHARDKLGLDTMVILATSLTARLEQANDLAGAPVLEDGRIVGVIRGRVPHPDSIAKQFTRLLYATSATRALEMLGRPTPAQDPSEKGIPIRPDDCCEGDERYAFVCYVGADEAFARRLANRLEGGGFRLFLGRQEMAGRSRLSPEEKNALDNSRFGLVLFSKHWNARAEQLEEAGALFRRAGSDSTFRLLTLRLDGTPLPPHYEALETIDFCGARPDQGEAIRALTRTMFAVKDEVHEMVREEFDRATDDVIREMIDARGAPKRIRAMAYRWRELRMAGVEPDLCAIELLIEAGKPEFALEVYERMPAWVKTAVRSRQLHARILLELDRSEDAAPVMDALSADGHLDAAMGLHLGASLLHRWNESGRRSHAHLRKAFEMYRTCYHRTSDVYAGLHAAALARFLDEGTASATIAAELLEAVRDVEQPTAHEAAAFGGASLLSGRPDEALRWFEQAVAHDPDAAEDIAAMHRVITLILETADLAAETRTAVESRIGTIFHVPAVAAFAGPPIDIDENGSEADDERVSRVRTRMRARLDALDVGHGVCSAGDRYGLIFAEEVLDRGGRVDLVLPYAADAFAYAGIPAGEVERFEAITGNPGVRVHEKDHVPGLDREAGYREIDARVRDLARRRSEARNGRAHILLTRDEDALPSSAPAPAQPGPTAEPVGSVAAPAAQPVQAAVSGMRDLGRKRKAEASGVIAAYRKVHALVVGVDEYQHWPHLSNASRDAQGVAQALEQRFGAHVRRLDNAEATAKRIEEVIKNVLRREVEPDDLVVFYFAGHGHTERLGNDIEHGFLVPVDAKEDSVADLMSLQDVSAWTEYLQCRHVLYIVDSCFSGFAGQAGGVTRRGGAKEARIAIAAGTAEQTVFDGGAEGGWSDHSVFTGYLLRGLEADLASSGRPIDETMLIGYLRENVLRATSGKQTPVYGFLPGHGSDYIRLVPRETK